MCLDRSEPWSMSCPHREGNVVTRPTRADAAGRAYLDLQNIATADLLTALAATFDHRDVTLWPLIEVIGDYGVVRAGAYTAYRRRLGPYAAKLPEGFERSSTTWSPSPTPYWHPKWWVKRSGPPRTPDGN